MYDFGSFLCRTLQHLKKTGGLKLDLKIHFWGLEKGYIHSWRQSDRTHTRKERSVWMCGAFTSYWKFGDIASAGFIFCEWWKPRARVRSQILIGDSPSPPPPAPGVRMRWPRRQLIMQPAQKGQIITARVCVCILLFSVRATGRRCEERRCTDTSPEATASKPKNIFINQSAHQHRESADGVFEFMNDDA